ncbi:hypothetical protein EA58_20080 [Photobacterium galatheae]|uniref:Uncharacterized protein n=2 Tax=Photobacterium galatheae TaxID=1654360 RepID=A0A066RQ12_9GAMM|nr:hypothetical protein EA58_20080 [Photobacterium galatheae]
MVPFASALLVGCLFSVGAQANLAQPSTAGTAVAGTEQQADAEPKEDSRYFLGLRGGVSLMGLNDKATVSGQTETAKDADGNGFWGIDFGYYTPEGRSRIYYSFERHQSDSQFPSSGLSYQNQANLHLLGTDYFFLYHKDFSPYVGLHLGYASVKSNSDYQHDYDVSGVIFGMQTGLAWRVSSDMTLEAGFRHSMLPSKMTNWQGKDAQGNSIEFQSQQRGVSSLFLAANYRY